MSDIIYNVTTKIAPQVEEEFNVWQETEHCPYLMTLPGYHSVIRYKDVDRPYIYFNCWHIESKASFDNPERIVKAATPWGKWLNPFRDRKIEFYAREDWESVEDDSIELDSRFSILVADGFGADAPESEALIRWYDEEYIPRAKQAQNVLEVLRFQAIAGKGDPENLVYHYLSGTLDDVLHSAMPELDKLLGSRSGAVVRRRYICTSKHGPEGQK
jgi:hypothetical protein